MVAVRPLDDEAVRAIEATVRRFCRRAAGVRRTPADLLAEAAEAGLLADGPDPEAAPGVWGPGLPAWGVGPSLRTLAAFAEADGAGALVLHLAGLARLVWPEAPLPATLALDAAVTEAGPAPGEPADGPPATGGGARAAARLVPWPDGLRTVLLPHPGGWRAAAPGDPGLAASPVGPTLGLRGLPFVELEAGPSAGHHLPPPLGGDGLRGAAWIASLHLLGLAAIGLGRARRAVARAVAYAGDRRQGGRLLRDQPVVQGLAGEAVAGLTTLEALLARAGAVAPEDPDLERTAAVAKTVGLAAAAQAATNALQILGGYGYMEDEPLAAAVRDCETLRVMHGRPARLTRALGLRRLEGRPGAGA